MAVGWVAITPRPPNFLDIRLKAPWQVVVNDSPHVRLIQPHSKCYRGNDNPQPTGHELVLHPFPHGGTQARMVAFGEVDFGCLLGLPPSSRSGGWNKVSTLEASADHLCHTLCLLLACAVDNDGGTVDERTRLKQLKQRLMKRGGGGEAWREREGRLRVEGTASLCHTTS